MKKVYVSDSFHTQSVAETLQNLYGSEVSVVCELRFDPGVDSMASMIQAITDSSESYKNQASIDNIDLFFISARMVLDGQIKILDLKKKYGNKNSKVVVMSTLPEYLTQVSKGNYGADYLLDKDPVANAHGKIERLDDFEKDLLKSFLH
jgi:hypothetical protein